MRNLLLFLLILIGIYYLRRLLAGDEAGEAPQPPTEPPREAETVLPCAHCGLLVPASEGIAGEGNFFCSADHLRIGPAAR